MASTIELTKAFEAALGPTRYAHKPAACQKSFTEDDGKWITVNGTHIKMW